jgi:hypothetical protein
VSDRSWRRALMSIARSFPLAVVGQDNRRR